MTKLSPKTNLDRLSIIQNLPLKLSWVALEHEYHAKSPEWYWALGIITAALVLTAVILSNFLFAILGVLIGFSIGLFGSKKPRRIKIELNPGGINFGQNEYIYNTLSHFWIDYIPTARKILSLESKKKLGRRVIILLDDADPEEVRSYLLQYLPEKKIEETLTEVIARILKF